MKESHYNSIISDVNSHNPQHRQSWTTNEVFSATMRLVSNLRITAQNWSFVNDLPISKTMVSNVMVTNDWDWSNFLPVLQYAVYVCDIKIIMTYNYIPSLVKIIPVI